MLLDARSHVHCHEAGGIAFHSQANTLAIQPSNGHHLTLEDVEANLVTGDDIHSAPTRIVALENTLSGTVIPQSEVCRRGSNVHTPDADAQLLQVIRISDKMRAQGVIMHCDGARMWEVVAKTGLSLEVRREAVLRFEKLLKDALHPCRSFVVRSILFHFA